jgi:hypothetical protein
MKKRALNSLLSDEKGQTLIIVVVLMLISALIIAPMLSHVATGLKTGKEVYEERMHLFYSADSGFEDGLWQINSENLDTLFTGYDPYEYGEIYAYPDSLDINDKNVDVQIENVWILKDISTPASDDAQAIIEGSGGNSPPLVINGSVPGSSTYQIKITYYYDNDDDPGGLGLEVDRIGIWLPPGFDYAGGCSLADDEDTLPFATPNPSVPEDYCSGKVVLWNFSSVPLADFAGDNDYPMERDITFQFSGPSGSNPSTALSWVDTDGVSDIDYVWDGDVKIYKVTSTAIDDTFDPPKQTIVEGYTAYTEIRELGTAIAGDYQAIGNSLLVRSRTDIRYRDTLLDESIATIQSDDPNDSAYIPASAQVDLALLYWSGWFEGIASNAVFTESCENFDDWQNGSRWTVYGYWDKEFQGRGGNYSEGAKSLILDILENPPSFGLDLSEWVGETIQISWDQDEEGRLEYDDTLWYAFSGDGGFSWSEYFEAFSNDNPPANFSDTIPPEYITDSFKVKFFVDFDRTNEYAYLDDIRISIIPETIADTTCIFKVDDQQVYFDASGYPMMGNQELVADKYQVIDNMSYGQPHGYSYSCMKDVTDLIREYTTHGAADYTCGSVGATYDQRDEWAYAGWSLVVVFTSPETRGHQLYLYDDFLYCNHYTNVDFDGDGEPGGTISGFLVPDPVAGEPNAAQITCFAGEGDDWYEGDYYMFNGTKLDDGTSSINDVWNGRSVGMSAEGIDVDTFYVTWSSGLLEEGDTSATVDIVTDVDIWNLIYTILSFRSDITNGGTISYLVTG